MAEPLSPEEEVLFETLWAGITQPTEKPKPLVCEGRGCKKPLGDWFHVVVHGRTSTNVCSLTCAIRHTKDVGEKISTHIKVERLGVKKK